jgi:aspartate carbamoyltransferase catalytic subunit
VVIVGDITHSRVARSNMWGLTAVGARVVVCGPPTLMPVGLDGAGCRERDELALPPVEIALNLDHAIEGADVVMALRLQLERQQAGLIPTIREYARLYQVNAERLARAQPGALVLHPGPVNEGIEISPEVAHGAHSLIEEQVTNGVAVRMAVLYLLAGGQP